eukprot:2807879-Pyramimonas_sp.AAC.1
MPAWCSQSMPESAGGEPKDGGARPQKVHESGKQQKDIIVPIAKLVMANSSSIADTESIAYVKFP